MGIEAVTGLGATRGSESSPDFTFIWSVTEEGGQLVVGCSFGGGTNTNNYASASVPWGNTDTFTMQNAQNNPAIAVNGKVNVLWSTPNDPSSYIVVFSGAMVENNTNNVFSADQEGVVVNSDQIIVAAYISS